MSTTDAALRGRSRNAMRNRYARAAGIANRYITNIALSGSYQRSALAGNEENANARKYSRATYMGVKNAVGSHR